MGLDIAFRREEAVNAGMETATMDDGVNVYRVPGMDAWGVDGGGESHVVTTANKWGRIYAPLTAWLRSKEIAWEEG